MSADYDRAVKASQRAVSESANKANVRFIRIPEPGQLWSVFTGTNAQMLTAVARIWVRPQDSGMDVTWGRGRWRTDRLHSPGRFTRHDRALDGVNFRHLPEADLSRDCVYYDPPYTDVGSRTSSALASMYDGYGLEPCRGWHATAELIAAGVKECARVLAPSGRLFAKCGNSVSGGHRRFGLIVVFEALAEAGLSVEDMVVHFTRPRPQPPGRRQMHSLDAASFLVVAQKPPLVHPMDRTGP
jgi:hypothetical protein